MRNTRRDFLKASGLAAAASAMPSCAGSDRPNILWVTCEDLSSLMGCYGDEYAHTPNIDRLAEEGVRFTNAFATAPVCTPARSCLITGIHAVSLGTHNLRGEMPPPANVRCYTEYLRDAGYYCTNNVKEDYNFPTPPEAWDESSDSAHWRNNPGGKPFFSIFNLMTTHQSQVRYSREEWEKVNATLAPEERYDPARAPLPPYYPDTPTVRLNMATLYTQVTRMDKQVGEFLQQLADDGLAENTIVFFYSDHGTGLPRGKRWLHHSGIQVPLVIRFPEKYRHLAPAAPGGTFDEPVSFVDFPPTMLSLTGLPIPDYMQGRAFLGSAKGEPRQYIFAARDRVDEVLEVARTVSDGRYQYIRNYMPQRPRMQRSDYSERTPIRQEVRRLAAEGKLEGDAAYLAAETKPAEELFDTHVDPHEVRNLAGTPEHAETLARLRNALRTWMLEVRDTGLIPEPDLVERAAGASPYDMARTPGKYAIERVLDAANLVGAGTPAEMEKHLSDEDAAVRYWAAVGLAALREKSKPAEKALLAALKDPSPAVRCAAAEACAYIGHQREALSTLSEAILDQDSRIALHAATIFVALGNRARSAYPTLKKALEIQSQPEQQRLYLEWALAGLDL